MPPFQFPTRHFDGFTLCALAALILAPGPGTCVFSGVPLNTPIELGLSIVFTMILAGALAAGWFRFRKPHLPAVA